MSSRNQLPFTDWKSVAAIIDHTNLRPEATPTQIARLCDEARDYGFCSVMVNACYTELCASRLRDSGAKVGVVAGFPLGATLTSVKRFEAAEALKLGAREIDMVLNIGELKTGNRDAVSADIRAVAEVVKAENALLKIILETHLLTDDEKRLACEISEKASADFVKTSTGFLGGAATLEDVKLMRRAVSIGVKASGGIRTAADALAMLEAGATRLGTSSGVNIVQELRG
jgi:deoxyribose-phosphate aldolase